MAKPPSRIPAYKTRREQAAAARAERAAGQEKAAKTTLEDAKKLLDGSALTNRNLLIAFYILLTTGLMLCLGITDEQLLLNKAPVPLPFLNLTLPIWAFASVVPLLLLVGHFDLLHNLNEHSRKLQAWLRAWEGAKHAPVQGEAGTLPDQLFPFVYDFAWLHTAGKGQGNINSKLLPGLCWALYCWAPFTVLIIFFIRFADLQNYWFTGWHLLLVLLDAAWLHWYWPRFPKKLPTIRWLPLWLRKWLKLPTLLMPLSVLAGCWTLWLFAEIQRALDFDGASPWIQQAIRWEEKLSHYSAITLVPRITVPRFEAALATNHFAMTKPQHSGKKDAELWREAGPSIDLVGRRLGFADLSDVVLPRANLERAQLNAANLARSTLPGANLSQAQLQGASLRLVNLRGASLRLAQLQGAGLEEAQLQGADLRAAQLQGANLQATQLQGAQLQEAKMLGSDISASNLYGTVLPAETQLAATTGTPTWEKPARPLQTEVWATAQATNLAFQTRLKAADNLTKATSQQHLREQNPQEFAKAWLKQVCQRPEVAKAMLQRRYLYDEIPDTLLREWLKNHEECQPYQTLAEQVINRKLN